MRELSDLVESNNPFNFITSLESYARSPTFFTFCESIAFKMITNLHTDNARTWRQAASESSEGRKMHEAIRLELQKPHGLRMERIILENARYIQNIPITEAQKMTKFIAEQELSGIRTSEITRYLQKQFPEISKSRAALIARTETSKAQTTLTQVRAQNLGINWYVWRTSKDARVRESHRKMQGVLCNYNDPPEPEVLVGMKSEGSYNAGEIYNCRCYAQPLIDVNLLDWPHKVYWNGQITNMSISKFKNIA